MAAYWSEEYLVHFLVKFFFFFETWPQKVMILYITLYKHMCTHKHISSSEQKIDGYRSHFCQSTIR